MKQKFQSREKDWKNGALVYQVIVDRFAPSKRIEEKVHLYATPLKLKKWAQKPTRGKFNQKAGAWQHELDFWGGDLNSLAENLSYLKNFSADVLYLNPIFKSLTNHKYDTHDYFNVDPVYGTNADFKQLVQQAHSMGLKVMLDGVFNHVGRSNEMFAKAVDKSNGELRDYFRFKNDQPVCWNDVHNLPELDLNNQKVKEFIYSGENSVVKHWIEQFDIDGWRLDVACEFGCKILSEINLAAKEAKAGAAVIGEIWNYPKGWYPAVDGVINMHARSILLRMMSGNLSGFEAIQLYQQMIDDCGMDHMLKAWLLLDNHDTPRLASVLNSVKKQSLARILQFTLPGAVCVYYGSEYGLKGNVDPEQRAPLPWDKVDNPPELFKLHQKLGQLRRSERALKVGDFQKINGLKTFSFMRTTENLAESIIVCANPTGEKIRETLQLRDGRIHDNTVFSDLLSGKRVAAFSGFLDLEIAANTALILKPDITDSCGGYSKYKYLD